MVASISQNAELLSFVDLAEADWSVCISLLAIRNEEMVRNNMYTDHLISEEEHRIWVNKLNSSVNSKYYAVVLGGIVIGGAGIYAIDRANSRADWSFYITSSLKRRGFGAALEYKLLNHAFFVEGLKKLNCEVFAWNTSVISLHKKFGFVQEGIRRRHVVRGSDCYDVVLLGIQRDEWERTKVAMMSKSNSNKDSKYYLEIIDQIQEIRSKNNKNWMDLLRLSFTVAPTETAQIVAKIYEDDGAISELAKKLTE